MKNKTRDHFLEFVYYNYRNIKNNLFPMLTLFILFVGENNVYAVVAKYIFYLFIPFLIIYSFFQWLNKTFEIKDGYIYIREGVFKNRRDSIPIKNVKTIHTNDDVLKRIFNIKELQVETIGGKKISFVLNKKEIVFIKEMILNKTDIGNEQSENVREDEEIIKYKWGVFDYFLISLSNLNILVINLSFVLLALSFLSKFDTSTKNDGNIIEVAGQVSSNISTFVLAGLILFFGSFIIAYIFSYIYIFVTYHNFRVKSNSKSIIITYGLVNKKEYNIPKKDIRSFQFSKPPALNLFGYSQISLNNIGSKSRSVLLTPLIKDKDIPAFFNQHINVLTDEKNAYKPDRKYIKNYIFRSLMTPTLLLITLFYFSSSLAFFTAFFILVPIIHGTLKWKHSSIIFGENYIGFNEYKKFTKRKTVIADRFLQSTSSNQSFLMKRNGSYHLVAEAYNEGGTDVFRCDYLNESDKLQYLDYLDTKNSLTPY